MITDLQAASQQRRTVALSLAERLNADGGQVPVNLFRMSCPYLLQNCKNLLMQWNFHTLLHSRAKRLLIRANG